MESALRTVSVVTIAAALGAAALAWSGGGAVLDPLEARLLFSPRAVDKAWLHSFFAGQKRIEEVRIVTPDGVTLHGWLKRPSAASGARPYPLVIVYGGVRHEISEFVRRGDAAADWGWLVVNYRGFGLS